MRIQLAVAVHVYSVFINVQANMAADSRRINMGTLFTNSKLPSIHSESVPRIKSKASTFNYTEIKEEPIKLINAFLCLLWP